MNIILAEPHEVEGTGLTLTDHRAKHIVKVLRAEVGSRLRVGQIDGPMGLGTILSINKKFPFLVTMELELTEQPKDPLPLDLILALPRPIMLKRVLSQVTALGVGTIHLVNAGRVEKSFWEAGILQPEEYRTHLLHGLEQAVDTRLPNVVIHRKFKLFIEDFFPGHTDKYQQLLLAHPTGKLQLKDVITNSEGRVGLAVGPEGGWLDYEVEKFEEQGFYSCNIGERLLKVDTAVVAMHARISSLLEI